MFTTKKISNRWICFGPGMKKFPGKYYTKVQALAALKSHKDEFNLKNLPALVSDASRTALEAHTEESEFMCIDDIKNDETIAEIEDMEEIAPIENPYLPQDYKQQIETKFPEQEDMAKKPTNNKDKGVTASGRSSSTTVGTGLVPPDQGIVFSKPKEKAGAAKTNVKPKFPTGGKNNNNNKKK